MKMALPVRKHPRLKTYDYSQNGCYHITVCTKNRRPILSSVKPAERPTMHAGIQLSKIGMIVDRYIQNIPAVYPNSILEKYVIMPNHVHLLLTFSDTGSASVPTVVRSLKRMVTKELGQSIWQDSYYDVIIRSESMFQCEWEYIDSNPDKWEEDTLFVSCL